MKRKDTAMTDNHLVKKVDHFWSEAQKKEVVLRVTALISILLTIISLNITY